MSKLEWKRLQEVTFECWRCQLGPIRMTAGSNAWDKMRPGYFWEVTGGSADWSWMVRSQEMMGLCDTMEDAKEKALRAGMVFARQVRDSLVNVVAGFEDELKKKEK